MRVLHIYRTYFPDPPGGLQEAIRQIALSTMSRGVENRIFCLSPEPIPTDVVRDEGLVVRSKSWAAPASCDIGLLHSMRLFAHHCQWADIVHYHFPWPFADFLRFTVQPSKPTVMTYHSDVVGKGMLRILYTTLMRKMLRSMSAVVATSPAYIDSSPVLKSTVKPQCLRVIPLGIGEETYSRYLEKAKDINLKERFGLESGNYFLFIGVLRPYKGLDYLVKAAEKVDLPIVIAGNGYLMDHIARLSDQISNIHLLGQVTDSEKMSLIQGCRALILPSHLRSEAFGMVLVEAAMCSKPLITCEIGTGTTFVNAHNKTGLVVAPESPTELAAAMNRLASDATLANHLGAASRKRYEELFSGEALGNAYVKLYNEFIDR
jgi:glycosyltransferase involved in cell wall biosynthesis